jgi:hypothetical protein
MIKHMIIALLIALPVVASANTRDKYPKAKGFNYKKNHRKVKRQLYHSRHSQSCRQWQRH